jgi:hypothetical protein
MKTCKECGIECELTCVEQILEGPTLHFCGMPIIACGRAKDNTVQVINEKEFAVKPFDVWARMLDEEG